MASKKQQSKDVEELEPEVEEPKEPDVEESKEQEVKQSKEEPQEDFVAIINDLKAQHEKQVADLKDDYNKQIEERNKLIRQLVSNADKNEGSNSVADIINKQRNFKKW